MGFAPAARVARKKAPIIIFTILVIANQDGKMDDMGKKKTPNPHAQALGSLGGKARAANLPQAEIAEIASKGGAARAAKLSAAERSRIAKLAVQARERKRAQQRGKEKK